MATTVSFNGTNYSVPNNRDPKGWGTALTAYLVALGTALAKSGGNFTLTADVNFGANYGIIAVYYKSASASIATVGVFRLANNEGIAWRNAANDADFLLKVDASNDLVFDGNRILDTTDIIDEDDMVSDSATKVPTQQSVKAYVDAEVGTPTATPTTQGKVTSFEPVIKSSVNSVSDADYAILDTDGYSKIVYTALTANRTVTLPTAADNNGRIITVKREVAAAFQVIIDGEGSETIDGSTTKILEGQYSSMTLFCNGTGWDIIGSNLRTPIESLTVTATSWTTERAIAYAREDGDGNWMLEFSFVMDRGSEQSIQTVNFDVTGVTFKSTTDFDQAVAVLVRGSGLTNIRAGFYGFVNYNSSNVSVYGAAAASIRYMSVSGVVELDSKPSWA